MLSLNFMHSTCNTFMRVSVWVDGIAAVSVPNSFMTKVSTRDQDFPITKLW